MFLRLIIIHFYEDSEVIYGSQYKCHKAIYKIKQLINCFLVMTRYQSIILYGNALKLMSKNLTVLSDVECAFNCNLAFEKTSRWETSLIQFWKHFFFRKLLGKNNLKCVFMVLFTLRLTISYKICKKLKILDLKIW